VRSVPRRYEEDKLAVSAVRQSPVSKDVNTEVEGSTALEAVTRQQLKKTEQTENIVCVVYELATAL
jgi:hypothetical protein